MPRRDPLMDRLREVLGTAGCRVTQQRIEVYKAVAGSRAHPSVAEVHECVRRYLPTVSLDTVYRTLWKLSELGLVSTVHSSGEKARFDADLVRHHHFTCARCGGTFDFESSELDGLKVPDEAWSLGRVWGARLEVRGLCISCCDGAGGGIGGPVRTLDAGVYEGKSRHTRDAKRSRGGSYVRRSHGHG